jgi:uncharacterized lipoprotein YmbA
MRGSLGLVGIAFALIALAAGGCRVPGKASPPTNYWVLAAVPGAPAEDPRHFVGVGPFELPAYLERSEIVTRVGDNQLRVSEFDNWGEKLADSFKQTLARNLEVLAPGSIGVVFPWKGPTRVQYRVTGVVTRFEVVDERAAQLEATWAFTRVSDGQMLGRGTWVGQEPLDGRGTAAGVAALSRALAALSREIAKPIAALD